MGPKPAYANNKGLMYERCNTCVFAELGNDAQTDG